MKSLKKITFTVVKVVVALILLFFLTAQIWSYIQNKPFWNVSTSFMSGTQGA